MGPSRRAEYSRSRLLSNGLRSAGACSFLTMSDAPRVFVVTPMTIERRGLGALRGATVVVSGPGPSAFRQWASASAIPRGARVILAGVAGGLDDGAALGEARQVDSVVFPDGSVHTLATVRAAAAWRVLGADHLIATPALKRELGTRHRAAIVDMESHVFIEESHERGWRPAIVRGVSDTADDELPPEVMTLLTPHGGLRGGAALALLARRPGLAAPLLALGKRTSAAMRAVRPIVDLLVRSELGA